MTLLSTSAASSACPEAQDGWARVSRLQTLASVLTPRALSRARLQTAIATFSVELVRRRNGHEMEAWGQEAEALLKEAEAAGRDVDRGWACFNAAVRASVPSFNEAEQIAERIVLVREANEKLDGWRRKSVLSMLQRQGDGIEILQRAMRIRDESAENDYRRTGLIRGQLAIVSVELAAALAALLSLELAVPVRLSVDPEQAPDRLWALVFLFGVVGGCISVLQRVMARRRVPQMLAHALITAVRPLFGGAAALVAYPLLASGAFGGAGADTVAAVYGVAFLAGFSEHLVIRGASALAGEGADRSADASASRAHRA